MIDRCDHANLAWLVIDDHKRGVLRASRWSVTGSRIGALVILILLGAARTSRERAGLTRLAESDRIGLGMVICSRRMVVVGFHSEFALQLPRWHPGNPQSSVTVEGTPHRSLPVTIDLEVQGVLRTA